MSNSLVDYATLLPWGCAFSDPWRCAVKHLEGLRKSIGIFVHFSSGKMLWTSWSQNMTITTLCAGWEVINCGIRTSYSQVTRHPREKLSLDWLCTNITNNIHCFSASVSLEECWDNASKGWQHPACESIIACTQRSQRCQHDIFQLGAKSPAQ